MNWLSNYFPIVEQGMPSELTAALRYLPSLDGDGGPNGLFITGLEQVEVGKSDDVWTKKIK